MCLCGACALCDHYNEQTGWQQQECTEYTPILEIQTRLILSDNCTSKVQCELIVVCTRFLSNNTFFVLLLQNYIFTLKFLHQFSAFLSYSTGKKKNWFQFLCSIWKIQSHILMNIHRNAINAGETMQKNDNFWTLNKINFR